MYPHWKSLHPSHCVYDLVMAPLKLEKHINDCFKSGGKGGSFMSRCDYVVGRCGYTLTSIAQSSKRNLRFV